jgi:Leucine-rich repeat (LRR) protein
MMKNTLFILMIPLFSFGQFTFVPDDNFEQALINLGVDFMLDDYVETQGIDTITNLNISSDSIADLTGIENFMSLRELFCYSNQILFLDLSNNTQLFEVSCSNNLLMSIDLRNGNNQGLWYFNSMNNQALNCIDVDDVAWADYNWARDTWTSFSTNCSVSGIDENKTPNKRLLKVVDIFGRSIMPKPNIPLLYIFDDGTVEKRISIQ